MKFALDILKDVEMDEEFKEIVEKYAEKEPTPMEMDLKVRMDRVIYVLNRALFTIKILMYLPTFLHQDAYLLKNVLPPEEVYFVLKLLNRHGWDFDLSDYNNKKFNDYCDVLENTNIHRTPHRYNKQSSLNEPMAHPQVSQMINILFNNKCVRQIVRTEEDPIWDRGLIDFMNTMEKLKQVMKDIIYETGEEEAAKDKELRQAYKHNVLVVASIKEMEARIEKQRKHLGEQLNKKVAIFQMYNKKMEAVKEDFQVQVEASLVASEKEMMNRTVISEEKQVGLAEEAKKKTKQYELLLEEHLSMEKITRSKRFKAETQLQNWLIKYDQDMGDRQAEYEALKAKYDEEREEMDELEEKFEEQEVEYTILMEEKREEDERIYNEMAYHLLLNRSARIIQRAWRRYIERKKARKKARKGKGKGGKGGKGKKAKKSDLDKAMERKLTEKSEVTARRAEDPNAVLGSSKKFKSDVFDEIQDPHAFDKKEINLDL